MKKILYSILIIFLFIPILVNASSFNSASGISKRYINNFLNPDRYIKTSRGDLISKEEVELTIVRKDSDNKPLTISSYMFDGTKFWAKEAYIIGEEIIKNATGDAKTKVTEIVKHETKVKGTGKYNDPWMFVDSFKVTVKSNGHGTIDGTDLVTKSADAHGSVSFVLEPVSGYKYLNNTCGTDVTGNILRISNVEKDIVCYVNFETSLYANTLPVPYKVVHINLTNSDVTYRFDNTPQGPVPNTFSSRYLNGYYTDDTLKTRLGKLTTLPSRDGWTFKGYYVGDKLLVGANGFFETTYSLLKDNENKETITFKVEENKYKITFNRNSGTGGTGEVNNWPYEHDMPSISIPGRAGYTFEGYYSTNPNGTFKYKYYDSTGKAVKIFKMDKAGDLALKANWTICPVGSYCPGDNVAHRCPNGYSTASTGSTTCTQCRYWDSCNYTTNDCRYGCDWCPGRDLGGYTDYVRCMNYCAYSCSGTHCISPGGYCNCSSCHHRERVCHGAWVYIQNQNQCVNNTSMYTVNLDKQGGTGGTNSYELRYYGSVPVAIIDGDKDKDTISIPTKAGYVFEGYYTATTGGTKIIDKNYIYSSSFNSNNAYTNEELNNLITGINGKIVELNLKSKVSPSGSTFTLYAHWKECPKGSRCPGDNKEWLCKLGEYQSETAKTTCSDCPAGKYSAILGADMCKECPTGTYQNKTKQSSCEVCVAGTFQDQIGQTSCKNCVAGSYSASVGQDKCEACQNGKTSNAKSTSCDKNCSNKSNVSQWETATWNTNNTVSNSCKIKACNSNYKIENNTCVLIATFSFKYTGSFKYKDGSGAVQSANNTSINIMSPNWYIWFLSDGTLTSYIPASINAFLVAGGESGKDWSGNGGSGGGSAKTNASLIKDGTYTIDIGGSNQNTTAFSSTAYTGQGARFGDSAKRAPGSECNNYAAIWEPSKGRDGYYAWDDSSIDGVQYGAGGGGGGYCCELICRGGVDGGSSGGGRGENYPYGAGTPGAANTGGGGGGGGNLVGYSCDAKGKAGGSGIVIIRNSR